MLNIYIYIYMFYNLKLKNIDFNNNFDNNSNIINEDYLIELLEKCYDNCAFSVLPYLFGNNSEQSINKFNSGDCVALSIYLKNELKKKNITSYLIPASIPKKYQLPGYLDISHVALAVPVENNIFVLDAAFYFLNPMKINLNQSENLKQIIFSKNIYTDENESSLENYHSIDRVIYCLKNTGINDIQLNNYQILPKNTYFINSCYKNDESDDWNYYLIEVLNPDEAITTFFLNIKKTPFISTTFKDKNGVCSLDTYIMIHDNSIKFKKEKNTQYFDIDKLNQKEKDIITNNLYKFLDNHNLDEIIHKNFKNVLVLD